MTSELALLINSATTTKNDINWPLFLEIVDFVNNEDASKLAEEVLLRSFLTAEDEEQVYLTLALVETLMKNCGVTFASSLTPEFMDVMVNLSLGNRGEKNSFEGRRLIQQWSKIQQSSSTRPLLFKDVYVGLKAKGMRFVEEKVTAATFESPSSLSTSSFTTTTTISTTTQTLAASSLQVTNQQEFSRLDHDLKIVDEKARLCKEMLCYSKGIEHDTALREVLGYLEACRDRLADVIEAGTHGLLEEELFARVLRANDNVLRVLESERTGIKGEVGKKMEKISFSLLLSSPTVGDIEKEEVKEEVEAI